MDIFNKYMIIYIILLYNSYPLDFPFSQIILHSKYILQKKTLEFLVHVLVKPPPTAETLTSSKTTTKADISPVPSSLNNKKEENEDDDRKEKISFADLANQLKNIREELYKKVNGLMITMPENLRNDEIDISIEEDFEKIKKIETQLLENDK